jgi:hypothetical protein
MKETLPPLTIFVFCQGIRALAKSMKRSGQNVYFCGATQNVEDVLQGSILQNRISAGKFLDNFSS